MYSFRYVRNSITKQVGEGCKRGAELVAPGGAHSHETDCILAAEFRHPPEHPPNYERNSIIWLAGGCCIRPQQLTAVASYERIPTQMGRVDVRVDVCNL